MSSWDQRIRDHRIWDVMTSLGRSIDDAVAIATLMPEETVDIERAVQPWPSSGSGSQEQIR
jgi:hypothetical protein